MRGNSMNNGNSFANGQSAGNGNGLLSLVKNHQGDGFQVRVATIYDGVEPPLVA